LARHIASALVPAGSSPFLHSLTTNIVHVDYNKEHSTKPQDTKQTYFLIKNKNNQIKILILNLHLFMIEGPEGH